MFRLDDEPSTPHMLADVLTEALKRITYDEGRRNIIAAEEWDFDDENDEATRYILVVVPNPWGKHKRFRVDVTELP